MALFLSTFTNKIDKKGRISVPSTFRAVIANTSYNGIISYASFVNPCIEACGMDRIERINQSIDALDPYSEERDAFATTILAGSQQLPFDGEGRVILPTELIEDAQLEGKAMFVGKGNTFEIWNPEHFVVYQKQARELARKERALLRLQKTEQA